MTTTVFLTDLPPTITHLQLSDILLQYVSPVSVTIAQSVFGTIARVDVLTVLDGVTVFLVLEHFTIDGVPVQAWLQYSARGQELEVVFSSNSRSSRVKHPP